MAAGEDDVNGVAMAWLENEARRNGG